MFAERSHARAPPAWSADPPYRGPFTNTIDIVERMEHAQLRGTSVAPVFGQRQNAALLRRIHIVDDPRALSHADGVADSRLQILHGSPRPAAADSATCAPHSRGFVPDARDVAVAVT
ncbi:MAG: hypothetical protein QM736_24345 [Vicinamibacterales bacterium]